MTLRICWIASHDPKCSEQYRDLTDWLQHDAAGPRLDLHGEKRINASTRAIVCWSISQQERAWEISKKHPRLPLFCFNWDSYEWIWKSERLGEYDWSRWGNLLRLPQCREVWSPSRPTSERVKQWWGVPEDRRHVIPAAVRLWRPATDQPFPPGPSTPPYVLNPLREIPDRHWGLVERACGLAGIECRSPSHSLSREDYERTVAGASVIVSGLHELSTGGLTCLEAYALGKPVLLSDSTWHGGHDYFGGRAFTFRDGDVEDCAAKISELVRNPPEPKSDCWAYVESNFSIARMGREIADRLARNLA